MKAAIAMAMLLTAQEATEPARVALETFNARLLAAPTATGVLGARCAEHRMEDPRIHAEVDRETIHPPTPEQLTRLKAGPADRIGYRRVRLKCGDMVLSEAENWFVRGRLTDAMNAALDQGDTPFGAVIAPLEPHRQNLSAEILWRPGAPMPADVLRHRALVLDRDGRPLAEVVETYKASVLASD